MHSGQVAHFPSVRSHGAVFVSLFQKVRQTPPTYGNSTELPCVLRMIYSAADETLRIRLLESPRIGVWNDSFLFAADGAEYCAEVDVTSPLRHQFQWQGRCLVAMLDERQVSSQGNFIDMSVLYWRSRAFKRVLHSTFVAETSMASESTSHAVYLWAYDSEAMIGRPTVAP
jgi:hypothetical protein